MKTSLITKLSLAVAATMLTLTPALAHGTSKYGYKNGYNYSQSKHSYGKRKHARKFHKRRRHAQHRRWNRRFFNSWRYAPRRW